MHRRSNRIHLEALGVVLQKRFPQSAGFFDEPVDLCPIFDVATTHHMRCLAYGIIRYVHGRAASVVLTRAHLLGDPVWIAITERIARDATQMARSALMLYALVVSSNAACRPASDHDVMALVTSAIACFEPYLALSSDHVTFDVVCELCEFNSS